MKSLALLISMLLILGIFAGATGLVLADSDDDDDENEDKEEASETIEEAEEEIAEAEEKIAEREAKGKDVSEALEILEQARDKLDEAKEAFDNEDFKEAEELAEEAEDLAEESRMGKHARNPDDDDDDLDEDEDDEDKEKEERFRRIGFSKTWRGHGWIDNGEDGFLFTGLWSSQKFLKVSKNDNGTQVEEVQLHRSFGSLKIQGQKSLRLVKITDSDTNESDSVEFWVIPFNRRDYRNDLDVEADAIGTLTLSKVNSFNHLTTWEGTLTLESPHDLEGSWDVSLGATKKTLTNRDRSDDSNRDRVNDSEEQAIEAIEKIIERRISFWERLQNFLRGRSIDNSEDFNGE